MRSTTAAALLLLSLLSSSAVVTTVQAANTDHPQYQDLLLVTRYANLTAEADSYFCQGGCRAREEDGCVTTRDFIIGGQCLAEDDGVWIRYSFSEDFGLCATEYGDPYCTLVVSEECGINEKCVDGWLQYELFEKHCIEGSVPTGEYVHPFVYGTTHRSMTNCTQSDPPTVEEMRLGSEQVCIATNIPMSDGSYAAGSLISACQPDNSHVVTFYSDPACTSQEGVLSPTYVRPLDQCTPGVTEETKHRIYTVGCGQPMVHCKMPTDNSYITKGSGSAAVGTASTWISTIFTVSAAVVMVTILSL